MKKKLGIALVVLLLLVSMTACGQRSAGQGTPAGETATTKPSADETAPGEKIQIVFWHTLTDHHQAALTEIADAFNTSQDQYEVVLEQQPYSEYSAKLLQAVSTGTGPDLVSSFPTDAANYINDGYMYDMAGFINDPENGIPNFSTELSPGLLAEITQWGSDSIYLIPVIQTGEVLFYNKTMFDALGLTEPKTWTDIENCARAIYEEYGVPGFGTDSIPDMYQCLITQAGSSYIETDSKCMDIDREIGIDRLSWLADGVKDGYFRLVGEDQYFSNPFGSQAVGMYIGSSAGIDYVYAAIPEGEGHFDLGCAPIPQEGPVPYVSNWASGFACLSQDEEHARGVYEFLKYFTSTDVCVKWAIAYGAVPVYASALETQEFKDYAETNIAVKALSEEIQLVGHLPGITGSNTVRTEIDKMVQSVALGVSDAEAAFDNFITASNAALNE